jgi:hypothetical protein
MQLPVTSHTSRPWRIHELTRDFEIEDVWAMPTPGGPDDFAHLVRQFDSEDSLTGAVSSLFSIRRQLGGLLGLDDSGAGIGGRVTSLRERLPPDLRDGPRGPDLRAVPFTSVYQTKNEWASEITNRVVHAVMHIGWVADDSGRYHGQMAVLVKANGWLGTVYMLGIRPFRHLGVYPALFRGFGRSWQLRTGGPTEGDKE